MRYERAIAERGENKRGTFQLQAGIFLVIWAVTEGKGHRNHRARSASCIARGCHERRRYRVAQWGRVR